MTVRVIVINIIVVCPARDAVTEWLQENNKMIQVQILWSEQ